MSKPDKQTESTQPPSARVLAPQEVHYLVNEIADKCQRLIAQELRDIHPLQIWLIANRVHGVLYADHAFRTMRGDV